MKLGFAGTPVFARTALEALPGAGHEVALVLTQPDRPAGRGLKLQPSPVKAWALERQVPVLQPRSLRLDGKYPDDAAAAQAALQAAGLDALVVAAYGLILPPWLLALPRLGCLNIHASLLPRWRGAAPIQRAIEAGDTHTGVTIMQMDAGLDTGDMLLSEAVPIEPRDTAGSLQSRLAALGARLIVQALAGAQAGELEPQPQPASGATYAEKITKAEAVVDWRAPASLVERRIRAFDPAPGASTALGGETLKLWAAEPAPGGGRPGTVLAVAEDGIDVACGEGAVRLTELQRPGGRRVPVRQFLQGMPLRAGSVLGEGGAVAH